jgi:uncharacterized protein (DUF433 family)
MLRQRLLWVLAVLRSTAAPSQLERQTREDRHEQGVLSSLQWRGGEPTEALRGSAIDTRVDWYMEVFMDPNLVSRDPEIMSGALCFAGTRVPVQNLFDYFEGTSSLEDFLEDFPSVQREKAVAVLEAAKERLFADAPAA